MKEKGKIHQKVEETLDVLNRVERVEPRPFFYTRLVEKMHGREAYQPSFSIRYAVAAGVILFLLNLFSVIKSTEWRQQYEEEAALERFIESYSLQVGDFNTLNENDFYENY